MTKKTKALVSSFVAIAMSASLATSATYALFTSEDKVSIAVTSGKVAVVANVSDFAYSTLTQDWTAATQNGEVYEATFDGLGGSATLEGKKITLDKIVPGDAVKFNVNVTNKSTVDVKYRVIVANDTAKETGLFDGLVLTVDGDVCKGVEGAWMTLAPTNGIVEKVGVMIELPETATNTYQGKSCEINVVVEAIQGNGGVSGVVKAENEEQVASALAAANATGEQVIVTLPSDVDNALTVGEGVNADLDLADKTVNNILVNNGTLDVSNGVIDTTERGFDNYGVANVENVTMTAGSATSYANVVSGAEAVTTYDNFELTSSGGAIGAADGGKVVFNSGTMVVNSLSTSGRYMFYLEGAGSEVVINGGNFSFTATNQNGQSQNGKRAYVYAPAGTKVTINGGTFAAFAFNTAKGYAGIRGDGEVSIKGGTFGFDPTAWVADGYEAVKDGSVWKVVAKA